MRGFIPLFLFGLIAIALGIGLTKDPSRMEAALLDKPFPEFKLSALDKPDIFLNEDVLQGQVSVVNVFGSWCVSCNVEHPILMNIAKDETVNMIGHNWRDGREKARSWLDKRGDPYDLILFDPDSDLAIPLGVTGAPETFITDKSGRVRYKHVGPIEYKDWDEILYPLIQNLKSES